MYTLKNLKVIALFMALMFLGCSHNHSMNRVEYQGDHRFNGLEGRWKYERNVSLEYAKTTIQKELIQSRVVKSIAFDHQDNFFIDGKKVGKVAQEQIESYLLVVKDKKLQMEYEHPYLIIYERSPLSQFQLYFTKDKGKS